MFEGGDPSRPPSAAQEARVDGKRVVLTGQDEVELRCDEVSISLRKDGKLMIRGAGRGPARKRAAQSVRLTPPARPANLRVMPLFWNDTCIPLSAA